MNLRESLQIQTWNGPLKARISVPGSKSLTNRALILAALHRGTVTLRGALWSEDTELMVGNLRTLGFEIKIHPDSTNSCNRHLTIHGLGGKIPSKEADLYVGTAGTVARFLAPFCALSPGRYRLHGSPRMHERPMGEVFDAIRALGGRVEESNGKLPAMISGPIRAGKISIPAVESSQSASGFLLISHVAGLEVIAPSSSYLEMTHSLLKQWSRVVSEYDIEPDASSASYFWALHHLLKTDDDPGSLEIERWPKTSTQIDHQLPKFLPIPETISRKTDLGDAVMTMVIIAAAQGKTFRLRDAGNLRKQECDRISAIVTELKKCGVLAEELSEEIRINGVYSYSPTEIETYQDHRMAMCFAVLGSLPLCGKDRSWITLRNPDCVKKTFPNFFETLEFARQQSS